METVISTQMLQEFFDTKERLRLLSEEIQVLQLKKAEINEAVEEKATYLLLLDSKGIPVRSRRFLFSVKEHEILGYINWQKEFKASYPDEYEALKAERGKVKTKEVCVAFRSSVV